MNRSLTAVPGVRTGHWTHTSGTTGTTVVVFEPDARCGVWIPGSATGSREIGALDPTHLAGAVHAICLSGGSAFGLAAADGVMGVLAEQGRGFVTQHGLVPIVPAAILYDLPVAAVRPGPDAGRAATLAASADPVPEGRVGAGAGARVAASTGTAVPGGTGSWSQAVGGHTVAALAVVNALGSIRDPETGEWVRGGEPQGQAVSGEWRGQTTLVVVATDAPLSRAQCQTVAKMASAGMARAILPAFTPFDGDIVFVASTTAGEHPDAATLAALGHAASVVVARAIVRGVSRE